MDVELMLRFRIFCNQFKKAIAKRHWRKMWYAVSCYSSYI